MRNFGSLNTFSAALRVRRVPGRARLRVIGVAMAASVTAAAAILGPASLAYASDGPALAVSNATVKCIKRPAIKPPPLGVVKRAAGRPGAALTSPGPAASSPVRPVCPAGQVPVIKNSPGGLPKGSNGLLKGRAAPGDLRPDLPCDGVSYSFEPGICFYYAGASDSRPDQGGGHTMTIERPSVAGSGHSLEELSVQGGPNNSNIVEIGSSVSPEQFGDSAPHLFVYHWINGAETCYSCNWQQYSNTYYPNMDLSNLVGHSVYNGYVYYQGNWWAWFNDQWVGYFPGSQWKGQFQTSQLVQWFGEVATDNGVPPLSQMGNGLFPSAAAAAPMSTLCDVNAAAWLCFYYDQQSVYRTDPAFYGVAHTGFGAIRLGGPGS
jgi:hypothetical protein